MKVEIFRVKKTKDYTIMSNNHLKNRDLSLKAKGLLSVILSLPDNWDYSINGLVGISKESRDGINATLQELEKNKYIVRSNIRDENGKFQTLYSVYETRQTKKQEKELKSYIKNYQKAIKESKKKPENTIKTPIRKSRSGKADTETPIRKSRSGKADTVKPIRKSRSGKADTVKPIQLNTKYKILKNKKLKENTNLILSGEDEKRTSADFERFKKNINLDAIQKDYAKKTSSLQNLQNILDIIKDLYNINDSNYIFVSGKKVYKKDIVEVLNKYDYDTIVYVLETVFNNPSEIKNIKAYTIATLLNAPKTIHLYYQGQVNSDFRKNVLKKHNDYDYDNMVVKDDFMSYEFK